MLNRRHVGGFERTVARLCRGGGGGAVRPHPSHRRHQAADPEEEQGQDGAHSKHGCSLQGIGIECSLFIVASI